jgi:MFS transporter, putative metabolite:H+ symporter
LQYTFIIAFAYALFPLLTVRFADRIEREWQVCLSCAGIALFGILFSMQSPELPLIIIGAFQTMMNAWVSFLTRNSQSGLFPTRMRVRAVGILYSWDRLSAIFTGFVIVWLLGQFGVLAVFNFVAGAMGMVVVSVALFGPSTNNLAVEEISH